MTGTSERTEHATVSVGEMITGDDEGPISSYVSEVEPGQETLTIETEVSTLREAVGTDLRDSYDDVHFWTDGETLAITDHRGPTDPDEADFLGSFDETVVRVEVVDPPTAAVRSLIPREDTLAALEELDDGSVTVLVEDNWPVVFLQGDKGTAVAPIAAPSNMPGGIKA